MWFSELPQRKCKQAGQGQGTCRRVSLDPGYEDQGQLDQGLVVSRCVGKSGVSWNSGLSPSGLVCQR